MLEKNQVPTLNMDVIESAFEGINVLEALAKNGLAIERCPRLPVRLFFLHKYCLPAEHITADTLKSLFKYLPEKVFSPNHQVGSTDIRKAAGVLSQTSSTSTSLRYATLQTPAYSNLNSVDRSNMQQEVAPSQQPGASQQDSDMMRMFLPPEMVAAQTDNLDDIFTHFSMDMFYANDDG